MTVFQNQVDGLVEFAVRLTNSTVTDIVDGTNQAWYVPWIQINENTGAGTPSLSFDLYDGTTAYPIGINSSVWLVKAMTAGQSLLFNEGIVVPVGWKLRGKSNNASGLIDFIGVKTPRVG